MKGRKEHFRPIEVWGLGVWWLLQGAAAPVRAEEKSPSPPVNVALRQTLIESSRNPFGWNGLVDGVVESDRPPGCYATDNDRQFPKSVTIDLGASYQINRVVIHNSRNGNTKTIRLSTSLDNQTWEDLWTHIFPPDRQYTFTHEFLPREARYVRVEFTDTNGGGLGGDYFMFLREVEVYGVPAGSAPPPPRHPPACSFNRPNRLPRSVQLFKRFALQRQQPVKIVAFGDSLTAGPGPSAPPNGGDGPASAPYWQDVATLIEIEYAHEHVTVVNAGVAATPERTRSNETTTAPTPERTRSNETTTAPTPERTRSTTTTAPPPEPTRSNETTTAPPPEPTRSTTTTAATPERTRSNETTTAARRRVWADVVAEDPDLVLLCFGVDDRGQVSAEEFRENLSYILSVLQKETRALLFLITPPPPYPGPPTDEYVSAVRELAAVADVLLIDFARTLSEPGVKLEGFYQDGRLNLAGHRLLSDEIFSYLARSAMR